jgi:hypothetical protein
LQDKGFNIFRISNSIPSKGVYSNNKGEATFENAEGNYLNFLRVGNKIFLPQYFKEQDDNRVFDEFNNYAKNNLPYLEIIKVNADATPLARYGGILNCISLQIFGEDTMNYHPFDRFVPVAKEEANNKTQVIYLAKKKNDFSHSRKYAANH